MSRPKRIDTTAHPNLPRYFGWMIESLHSDGRPSGEMWSLRLGKWVSPVEGQLFPTYKAASVYRRELNLRKDNIVTKHLFQSGKTK